MTLINIDLDYSKVIPSVFERLRELSPELAKRYEDRCGLERVFRNKEARVLNPDGSTGFSNFLRRRGIKILEEAAVRPADEDCVKYLFGHTAGKIAVVKVRRSGKFILADRINLEHDLHPRRLDPGLEGAFAFYNKTDNGVITHVGRMMRGGLVKAKMNVFGPLVESSPEETPISFGDVVECWVPKTNERLPSYIDPYDPTPMPNELYEIIR